MRVETGLSPAFALKAACVGKNAWFCYFKKNMGIKGLLKWFFKQVSIWEQLYTWTQKERS